MKEHVRHAITRNGFEKQNSEELMVESITNVIFPKIRGSIRGTKNAASTA